MGVALQAEDYFAIQNLIYQYARFLDLGDYSSVGSLFAHADVYVQETLLASSDPDKIAHEWRRHTFQYQNGTPRTRHLTTNVIIEADGENRARAESYVMVFQQTRSLPLQPIIGGDYLDRFAKVNGTWRFVERRVGNEMFGNLSEHLRIPITMPDGERRPQEW